MSNCRIERKRAHDREAQRASRAKTKAYITHLERTVQDLSEGTDGNRAKYLAHHASKQSQEIDNLRGLVGKIRTLLQDATRPEIEYPPHRAISEARSERTSPGSGSACGMSAKSLPPTSDDQWRTSDVKVADRGASHLPVRTVPRPPVVLGIDLLCEDSTSTDYLPRLNDAVTKVEKEVDNLSTLDVDQDIIVRAIVFGWDEAERVHEFDIVWRFLRAFDEGLWYRAGPLERMVNCWNVRSMMLFKMRPRNQQRRMIVAAAAPTARQQATPNRPAIVDYFVWPEVRNQILAKGIETNTGQAAIALSENFHFLWPYETRDAYKMRKSTGMYSLSEAFLARCDDISCYRVSLDHMLAYHFDRPWLPSSGAVDNEDTSENMDGALVKVPSCSTGHYPNVANGRSGIQFGVPPSDAGTNEDGPSRTNMRTMEEATWVEAQAAPGIEHEVWLQNGSDWMVPFSQDMGAYNAPHYALDAYSMAQAQWSMA